MGADGEKPAADLMPGCDHNFGNISFRLDLLRGFRWLR